MTTDPRLQRIISAQPYPLLFATISGAHLYGFPSPDSDFDLRGVHVLPLPRVLGLDVWDETVQDERIIEGLEMDIVSHDVRKFFGLLLKKNGYVLEQLFSPLIVHTTPEHAELMAICNPRQVNSSSGGKQIRPPSSRPAPAGEGELFADAKGYDGFSGRVVKGAKGESSDDSLEGSVPGVTGQLPAKAPEGWTHSGTLRAAGEPAADSKVATEPLRDSPGGTPDSTAGRRPAATGEPTGDRRSGVITRHHSHHYFGFAETQWKLFEKERPRRVKPLLYVYRVLLTGIHLMRTGLVEANLVTLNETFRLPFLPGLIACKLAGPEQSTLEDADLAFYEAEYQRLRGELQSAHQASLLPELPDDATRAALNDLLIRIRLTSK